MPHRPNSRSAAKNLAWWHPLERLAKDAAAVRKSADFIAAQILGRSPQAAAHKEAQAAAYKKAFDDSGLTIVASAYSLDERTRSYEQDIELVWHTLRAIVSAQLSGFSLDGRDSCKPILRHTLVAGKDEDSATVADFWSYGLDKPTAPSRSPTVPSDSRVPFARVNALFSACSFILPELEPWYKANVRSPKPQGIAAFIKGFYQRVTTSVPDSLFKAPQKKGHEREVLEAVALTKLRRNVNHIARRIQTKVVEEIPKDIRAAYGNSFDIALIQPKPHDVDLENALFAWLERLLSRGKMDSSALDVSDIARVLAGRYLNPSLQLEPTKRTCFREAVGYVLEKQGDDGGWQFERQQDRMKDDSLKNHYSPLVHVLDLPNELLKPHLESLRKAAERAIAGLSARLEDYRLRLMTGVDIDSQKVIETTFAGFVVGTATADRFKDLLSDTVLGELGAEEPVTDMNWLQVADSLAFKENISQGVVALWQKRSEQRPGAILVYGPPGTGKTTIAKVLARELNATLGGSPGEGGVDQKWQFLAFTPADFARRGSDRVVALAEEIFDKLRRVRRCVVLLDEMEEFLRIRGPEAGENSRLITTAFLPLLQEAVQSREIILVVATNFVGSIDPAVTRRGRFDLVLPLGPPNRKSREEVIKEIVWPSHTGVPDPTAGLGQRIANSSGFPAETIMHHLVEYTMGYSTPEILDFLRELERSVPSDGSRGDGHQCVRSPEDLILELWRIRQERVPTALSNRAGCNWRTFQDEAARYSRWAVHPEAMGDLDADYWNEPHLPRWDQRQPAKSSGVHPASVEGEQESADSGNR